MTKLFLLATAAGIVLASGPVVARDVAVGTIPAKQSATARAARPEQRYCVVYTVTGSYIPDKTCQTRNEWLKEGFDPLKLNK